MSKKYQKPAPTGREYVDATTQLCDYTVYRCMQLPHRWETSLLNPLMEAIQDIENCVITANKIYINEKTMNSDELLKAYEERLQLLYAAVRKFAVYDRRFIRLINHVDIAGAEKRRLKNILLSIIEQEQEKNPELSCIKIVVRSHMDEMEYVSASGSYCMKLKLTAKNKNYWLDLQIKAMEHIKKKIDADKKAVSRLKA